MGYKKKIAKKETLLKKIGNFPLNIAGTDRVSFSVLKDRNDEIVKIENVSYEMQVNDVWEWVVRYDDHGGTGRLHCHFRISLYDMKEVELTEGIESFKNKNLELTWACRDIKRNYLTFREIFLRNSELDLY